MRKYWKWIIVAIALLLIGLLAWFLIDYFSIPRLPPWEKEKVEQAYFILTGSDEEWYAQNPIIWYDENGYVEENKVWRYVGKYGDCYAFLRIGDNKNAHWEEVDIPCPVAGLDPPVYYPVQAFLYLYHTKRGFTYKEIRGCDGTENIYQLWLLDSMRNREEWITDEQLEQLTRDIEKLAKAHN